jgi:hypothetical protein
MNLPKTLKIPLLSDFRMRPQGIVRKSKYSLVFKTVFDFKLLGYKKPIFYRTIKRFGK